MNLSISLQQTREAKPQDIRRNALSRMHGPPLPHADSSDQHVYHDKSVYDTLHGHFPLWLPHHVMFDPGLDHHLHIVRFRGIHCIIRVLLCCAL